MTSRVPLAFWSRSLESTLRKSAGWFPAIVLTGPRQSGKTTLLRRLFGDQAGYTSFDTPEVRRDFERDPRGFLDRHPPPVIFDEVAHEPDLLSYLKERIDNRRSVPGQYFLTASQNLLLLEAVTESLAGRTAILRLFPLTWRELDGQADARLPWEEGGVPRRSAEGATLGEKVLRGGFPDLWARPGSQEDIWHSSYIQTYLERDVRLVRQVGDLGAFQTFVVSLAARTGQLLNLASLARDVGIALFTARSWLSVLEATHQIIIVRPYHASLKKRLVKTPKIYFTDTGTLCHLVGLRTPEHAMAGPMGGALFENAVVAEVYKTLLHRGESPRIYFWRTATGVEVDLLVEVEMELVPIEIKLNSTPRPAMADGILSLRRDLGEVVRPGFVVHTGEMDGPLVEGVRAIPFGAL